MHGVDMRGCDVMQVRNRVCVKGGRRARLLKRRPAHVPLHASARLLATISYTLSDRPSLPLMRCSCAFIMACLLGKGGGAGEGGGQCGMGGQLRRARQLAARQLRHPGSSAEPVHSCAPLCPTVPTCRSASYCLKVVNADTRREATCSAEGRTCMGPCRQRAGRRAGRPAGRRPPSKRLRHRVVPAAALRRAPTDRQPEQKQAADGMRQGCATARRACGLILFTAMTASPMNS